MRYSLLWTTVCAGVLLTVGCVPAGGPPPPPPPTTVVPPPQVQAVAVAAGVAHACTLNSDHTVSCWGSNTAGQLGNTINLGTATPNTTPRKVRGLVEVVAISTGDYHTCALIADGTVKCWGNNGSGQLGNTDLVAANPTPTTVAGLVGVVALSAAGYHNCAVTHDQGVWCWGLNVYGQLGRTANFNANPDALPVDQTVGAVGVSTGGGSEFGNGGGHSCAVMETGTMSCWGLNFVGELGNPNPFVSTTPEPVTGMTDVASASGGWQHESALLHSGDVWCWGNGSDGRVGPNYNGNSDGNPTPVHVDGVSGAVAIAAGQAHTCAVLSDGTMSCWGENLYGESGADPSITPPTQINDLPVPVPGITGATAVAANAGYTSAVHGSGAVSCWGQNQNGQLGNTTNLGTSTPNPAPLPVTGFP